MTAPEVPEGFPRPRHRPSRKGASGQANARYGKRRQRDGRKVLERLFRTDPPRFAGALGNEESWHHLPVRVECKAGEQVEPIATRFLKAETQASGNLAFGRQSPFVMLAMPSGMTDGLLIIRTSDLERFADLIVEARTRGA